MVSGGRGWEIYRVPSLLASAIARVVLCTSEGKGAPMILDVAFPGIGGAVCTTPQRSKVPRRVERRSILECRGGAFSVKERMYM